MQDGDTADFPDTTVVAATVRIEMNRRRIRSVQVEKIGDNGYLQGMLIGI